VPFLLLLKFVHNIPRFTLDPDSFIGGGSIRENAGVPDGKPGQPYSAPDKFSEWLFQEIGTPESAGDVVIFGLTLDCCVLCLAQELYFRGYKAHILYEAVDTYMGSKEQKDNMFDTPLPMWVKKITWAEVKEKLGK
jgi:hypothetical protein